MAPRICKMRLKNKSASRFWANDDARSNIEFTANYSNYAAGQVWANS